MPKCQNVEQGLWAANAPAPVEGGQGRGAFLDYRLPGSLNRPAERTSVLRPLDVLQLGLYCERQAVTGAI